MTVFGGDACGEFFNREAFWEFGCEDESIAVYLPFNFKAGFEIYFSFNAEGTVRLMVPARSRWMREVVASCASSSLVSAIVDSILN